MKQFFDDHFAVLVVLFVFILLFGSYMYQVRHLTNTGTVDWLEGEMKEVIGAILMGLTGGKVNQIIQGGKGGTQTTDSSSTTTPASTTH